MNQQFVSAIRLSAALVLIVLYPVPAVAVQTVWLSIIATESNVDNAVSTARSLHTNKNALEIIDTNDCHNLRKNLYVIVAAIDTQRQSARKTIEKWRERGFEDAYFRQCDIVQKSRLALRIPAVDNSFVQHDIHSINWDLQEAITHITFLNTDRAVIIKPQYQPDPEDIREGLKIRVYLHWLKKNHHVKLSDDCIDPELTHNSRFLAVSCVTENAADNLLHSTSVFSFTDGTLVFRQNRCRDPEFTDNQLTCNKETVDVDGQLNLIPAAHALSPASKTINQTGPIKY